jgi:hypothetical protein
MIDEELEKAVGVSNPTIKRIRKAYVEEGLRFAIEDGKRSGRRVYLMEKRGHR